jgi:hypothetical protein
MFVMLIISCLFFVVLNHFWWSLQCFAKPHWLPAVVIVAVVHVIPRVLEALLEIHSIRYSRELAI